MQAYRFALDLTPRQERVVLAHAGAARVAHNWALARVTAVMDQRAAERTYGITDVELTPAVGWSLPALRRAWNAAKSDVAPWWAECSKEAFDTGLDALARALTNWSDSRTGKRAQRARARPQATVGVDVGVTNLVVLSTGELVPNPRHLEGAARRMRRLARRMSRRVSPHRRTGQRPSKRWERARAQLGRTYTCTVCGLTLDRDLNAARNLAALAAEVNTAGSGLVAGREADRKTRQGGPAAVKRQPGIASASKTGTVPPQGGTSNHMLTKAS